MKSKKYMGDVMFYFVWVVVYVQSWLSTKENTGEKEEDSLEGVCDGDC